MDCIDQEWMSNAEFLEALGRKAREQRVPISGTIELTGRCNLRCVHCYICSEAARGRARPREMRTGEVLSVIDQVTDAGCLSLLLTGGEPLSRDDFPEVYRHAKVRGLLVTVFTNGTLIDESVIELFTEHPPRAVEITVYGATEETYDRVTGSRSAFRRFQRGLDLLDRHRIPLRLKTILMKQNRHEFGLIEEMARDRGVHFRFDAAIMPTLYGGCEPLDCRVPPNEAVDLEFSDETRAEQWKQQLDRAAAGPSPSGPGNDRLYRCGTGLSSFFVDASGQLFPCVMARDVSYDLAKGDFLTGWRDVIPRIREIKAPPDFPCRDCKLMALCGYCPPVCKLETGSESMPSENTCALGALRYARVLTFLR